MKYSLGLTAVTMVALSGLYIAGCTEAGTGMGILDPYETSSPLEPGHGGSASPTASPTKQVKEIFQDKLTNPQCLLEMSTMSNATREYGLQVNYWTLQYDSNGNEETHLVRIAADTEKAKSKTDDGSPHTMTLVDVNTDQEIILKDATCLVRVINPAILDFKSESKEVFSSEYNPNNSYLVLANNVKSGDNAQIIIINPNEEKNHEDTLYAKVLCTDAKYPLSISVDQKYIWWAECKVDAAIKRMDYTTNPDTIQDYEWRTKTYTAGLQYPEFIMSTGDNVYVADTGGNRVFIGPCVNENKEKEKSTEQVCQYVTNEDDGYYLLEEGFMQPYALTLLNNGKLLIADGSANPLFDTNDAPTPLNGNMGNIYLWDVKGPDERKPGEKIGTKVVKLFEGLNNPMMMATVYDATNDTTSRNAQYVDLLIPQYSNADGNSRLGLVRLDTTYRNAKVVKGNNFYNTNKTTCVYLLNRFISTDAVPADVPERQNANLQILYNEGINKNPAKFDAVIQYYNDDYPF